MSEDPGLLSQLLDYQEQLQSGADIIRDQTVNAGDKIRTLVEQFGTPLAIHYLKSGVEKLNNPILNKALEAVEGKVGEGKGLVDALKETASEAKGQLEDKIAEGKQMVKDGIEQARGMAEDAAQQARGVVDDVTGQVNSAVSEARGMANDFVSGIQSGVADLQNEAANVLNNVQQTGTDLVSSVRQGLPSLDDFVPSIPSEMSDRLANLNLELEDAKQKWIDLDPFDPEYNAKNLAAQADIEKIANSRDLLNFLKDDMVESQKNDFLSQGSDMLDSLQEQVGNAENLVGNILSSAASKGTSIMDMFASRAHGFEGGDFSTLARALGMESETPSQIQVSAEEPEAEAVSSTYEIPEFVRPSGLPSEVEMTAASEFGKTAQEAVSGVGQAVKSQLSSFAEEAASKVSLAQATAEELSGTVSGLVSKATEGVSGLEEGLASVGPETEGLGDIAAGVIALGSVIGSLFHKDKVPMVQDIPTLPTMTFGF